MMIHTSEASARAIEADALIVGVVQGADGPRPAPGADDVDDALGGTLTDLLTALDATGHQALEHRRTIRHAVAAMRAAQAE